MEIYIETKIPKNTEKIYYGFKLQLHKSYRWKRRIPVTELYFDEDSFYQNKSHSRFCFKDSLRYRDIEQSFEKILECPRVFDSLEEAKETWNSILQNYLDRYQSEFEKNYNNIKKYKI